MMQIKQQSFFFFLFFLLGRIVEAFKTLDETVRSMDITSLFKPFYFYFCHETVCLFSKKK